MESSRRSWSSYTYTEGAQELNVGCSMDIWHLKGEKLELTDKKNHRLDVLFSLILWDNNKPFFDQFVTWDKKVEFIQLNWLQWSD